VNISQQSAEFSKVVHDNSQRHTYQSSALCVPEFHIPRSPIFTVVVQEWLKQR
jgi:hypothetical protein